MQAAIIPPVRYDDGGPRAALAALKYGVAEGFHAPLSSQ